MTDEEFIRDHGGYDYTPLRIDKQETPDGNVFTMKVSDEVSEDKIQKLDSLIDQILELGEEDCESCAI